MAIPEDEGRKSDDAMEVASGSEEDIESESEEESEEPGLFDHLPHAGINLAQYDPRVELPDITALEVVCIMLDWMTTNKIHDAGAEDMWRRLRLFIPNVKAPTFESAKNLVKKHKQMRIQRIEICPHDCIAYWDCKHIPAMRHYKHAHRMQCPTCGEPRWVTQNGRRMPRKVVYFTPIGPWLQDLYKRTDLVPFLFADADGHSEGHVTRSRGWKKKVLTITTCVFLCNSVRHICGYVDV